MKKIEKKVFEEKISNLIENFNKKNTNLKDYRFECYNKNKSFFLNKVYNFSIVIQDYFISISREEKSFLEIKNDENLKDIFSFFQDNLKNEDKVLILSEIINIILDKKEELYENVFFKEKSDFFNKNWFLMLNDLVFFNGENEALKFSFFKGKDVFYSLDGEEDDNVFLEKFSLFFFNNIRNKVNYEIAQKIIKSKDDLIEVLNETPVFLREQINKNKKVENIFFKKIVETLLISFIDDEIRIKFLKNILDFFKIKKINLVNKEVLNEFKNKKENYNDGFKNIVTNDFVHSSKWAAKNYLDAFFLEHNPSKEEIKEIKIHYLLSMFEQAHSDFIGIKKDEKNKDLIFDMYKDVKMAIESLESKNENLEFHFLASKIYKKYDVFDIDDNSNALMSFIEKHDLLKNLEEKEKKPEGQRSKLIRF